jgi:replicative DNA helicase
MATLLSGPITLEGAWTPPTLFQVTNQDGPPETPDTELALLGALLKDPARIPAAAMRLKPRHFSRRRLGALFAVLVDLDEAGYDIDAASLLTAGCEPGEIAALDLAANGFEWEGYVSTILQGAGRRALLLSAQCLAEAACDGRRPVGEMRALLEQAERTITWLSPRPPTGGMDLPRVA